MIDPAYFDELAERAKTNKIYQEFQLTALTLAELLGDSKHVSLYMRLAKTHPKQDLFRIAKTIAERPDIGNKGAYFMKVLKEEGYFTKTTHDKKKNRTR